MNRSRSSRPLKALVCGGGVAGQALTAWLARDGHAVTVIERFGTLRASGAQVDLRGQGIEVVERMGLISQVRDARVDEAGVALVDSQGVARATIMANTSGRGRQSLTSEYEIMRGDLVRILHDAAASNDSVRFRYGVGVQSYQQHGDEVRVTFSDGSRERFDLLIGADGQGSRIRAAMLSAPSPDPYRRLGLHMAYWFVPRIASDSTIRDTYNAPGGRMIMRRSRNPAETQVYLVLRETSETASAIHRAPIKDQKAFWCSRFRGAGWQADRFLAGMGASDFYSQEVLQVRIDSWARGRVGLLGDAAHCASPYSGMGVSAALVGAYVLAGHLHRDSGDPEAALRAYERTLRPFVDEVQSTVKPALLRLAMPTHQLGINALHAVAGLACALRIPDRLAQSATSDRGGKWALPDFGTLAAGP